MYDSFDIITIDASDINDLSQIFLDYYNSSLYWPERAKLNGLKGPNYIIYPGQQLVIPLNPETFKAESENRDPCILIELASIEETLTKAKTEVSQNIVRIDQNDYINFKWLGIERFEKEGNKYFMYSYKKSLFSLYLTGDIEEINGGNFCFSKTLYFLSPAAFGFDTRLLVNIEVLEDKYAVSVRDFTDLSFAYGNLTVGRTIKLYTTFKFEDFIFGEELYATGRRSFVTTGFSNALDTENPVRFEVPGKFYNISKIELVYDIFIGNSALFGYRRKKIQMFIPNIIE